LTAANFNIDHEEKKIFSPVGIIKYWSGAIHVATPYGDIFTSFLCETFLGIIKKFINDLGCHISFANYIPWLPKAMGKPVAYLQIFNKSDIATTWSGGNTRATRLLTRPKVSSRGYLKIQQGS